MLSVWWIHLKCVLFGLRLRFSGSQHIPWLSSFPVPCKQRLVAGEHTGHSANDGIRRQRAMLIFLQPRWVWEGSYSFQFWDEVGSVDKLRDHSWRGWKKQPQIPAQPSLRTKRRWLLPTKARSSWSAPPLDVALI